MIIKKFISTVLAVLQFQFIFILPQTSAQSSPGLDFKLPTVTQEEGKGAISTDTVNLNSGSVSLPLTLMSLSSREDLTWSAALSYSSKSHHQADIWNLQAPTGKVGLGWGMSHPRIILNTRGTGDPSDDSYFLSTDNVSAELIKIAENKNSIEYTTKQKYSQDKISFFPSKNSWVLTDTNGIKHIFGGGVSIKNGNNISKGNSIEWGVKWGDWIGSSKQIKNQEQFAVVWNISSIQNIWGEQMTFEYDLVEEPVGSPSGKKSTQASYLTKITSPTGEKIEYIYSQKNDFEYADLHTEQAINDAYQERFETKYLEKLIFKSPEEEQVKSAILNYSFLGAQKNICTLPNGNEDACRMLKRVLSSVTYFNEADIQLSPPQYFEYWGEDEGDGVWSISNDNKLYNSENGALYGAIKAVISPTGSRISYNYSQVSSDKSKKSITIKKPTVSGKWSYPRSYFGSDYALITWDGDDGLYFDIYEWAGYWKKVVLENGPQNNVIKGITNPSNVKIENQQNYVVIIAEDKSNENAIRIFSMLRDSTPYRKWYFTHHTEESAFDIHKREKDYKILTTEETFFAVGGQASNNVRVFSTDYLLKNKQIWTNAQLNIAPPKSDSDECNDNNFGERGAVNISSWYKKLLVTNTKCTDFEIHAFGNNSIFRFKSQIYDIPLYLKGDLLKPAQDKTSQDYKFSYGQGGTSGGVKPTKFISPKDNTGILGFADNSGNYRFVEISFEKQSFNFKTIKTQSSDESKIDFSRINLATLQSSYVIDKTPAGAFVKDGKQFSMNIFNGVEWINAVNPEGSDKLSATFFSDGIYTSDHYGEATLWQYNPNTESSNSNLQLDDSSITFSDGFPGWWAHFWTIAMFVTTIVITIGSLFIPGAGTIVGSMLLEIAIIAVDFGVNFVFTKLIEHSISPNDKMVSGRFYLMAGQNVYRRNPSGKWKNLGSLQENIPSAYSGYQVNTKDYTFPQTAETYLLFAITSNDKCLSSSTDTSFDCSKDKDLKVALQPLKNGEYFGQAYVFDGMYSLYEEDSISIKNTPNSYITTNTIDSKDATEVLLTRDMDESRLLSRWSDYVVGSTVVNDGFKESYTHYSYNSDTAQFSIDGQSASYAEVTVTPSGSSELSKENGYIKHYFLNNFSQSKENTVQLCSISVDDSENCKDVSNGSFAFKNTLAVKSEVYNSSQVVVSSEASSYKIVERENKTSDGEFFYTYQVQPVSKTVMIDGTVTSRDVNYDELGREKSHTTYNFNPSTGDNEVTTTRYSYVNDVLVYEKALNSLNIVAPIYQANTVLSTNNGTKTTLLKSTFTTWKDWGKNQWAPESVYTARNNKVPQDVILPVSDTNWLKSSQIINRDPKTGIVIEIQDATGLSTTTIYDKYYRFPVAEFKGGSTKDVAYVGFEDYENLDNIRTGEMSFDSSLIDKSVSHTGVRSLKTLITDTSFSPLNVFFSNFIPKKNKTYIISAWIKGKKNKTCHIGFEHSIGPWWNDRNKVTTTGEWQHVEYTAKNLSQWYVPTVNCSVGANAHVDSIRVSPASAEYTSTVYNSINQQIIANNSNNGVTKRVLYNSKNNPIASVDTNETVLSMMSSPYLKSSGGVMKNKPHYSFGASPGLGGKSFRFYDGDKSLGWSGGTINQRGDNKVLTVQSGRIAGYIPETMKNPSFFVTVQPSKLSSVDSLSVQLGTLSVLYARENGKESFEILSSGIPLDPPVKAEKPFSTDWSIYTVGNKFLFLLDGELLLQADKSSVTSKNIFLSSKGSPTDFSNMVFVQESNISVEYSDALTRPIQQQSMSNADEKITTVKMYNGWGELMLETKPAVDNTFFGYNSNFILFEGSGDSASGELSEYYKTGKGKVFAEGNDYKYAYSQYFYEESPLKRPNASIMAGEIFHKGFPIPGYTSSKAYGLGNAGFNIGETGISFLSDQFSEVSTDDKSKFSAEKSVVPHNNSDKEFSSSYSDQNGTKIASKVGNSSLNTISTTGIINDYETGGVTVTNTLPNLHDTSVSGTNNFKVTKTYNFNAELISRQEPDTGLTEYKYDKFGRLRFTRDAQDLEEDIVQYWKYDEMGRIKEKGYMDSSVVSWDKISEEELNNFSNFPSNINTWRSRYLYDHSQASKDFPNGSYVNLQGRIWRIETNTNNDPDVDISKTYSYDNRGLVLSVSENIVGYSDSLQTTSYQYDSLGRLTEMIYPGEGAPSLTYTYNNRGELREISDKNSDTVYAQYEYYTSNGLLKTESINLKNTITRNYTYNFLNQVTSYEDVVNGESQFKTSISYKKDGVYQNGNIQAVEYSYGKNIGASGFKREYSYDILGRLRNVSDGGLFDKESLDYDLNGNIKQYKNSSGAQDYSYIDGSNKLVKAGKKSFTYDANGNVVSDGNNTFSYDPFTEMVSSISRNGQTINYEYQENGVRSVKKTDEFSSVYHYGNSVNPISIKIQKNLDEQVDEKSEEFADSADEGRDYYIYGLNGIIAKKSKNGVDYFTKDHIGSTRIIRNENNEVKAYANYDSYGNLDTSNSQNAESYRYLYTGQEFDSEIDIYNYKARFYDQSIGRFYAVDSLREFASPYVYVGNNPIMYTDPSGRRLGWARAAKILGFGVAHVGIGFSAAAIPTMFTENGDSWWKNGMIGAGVGLMLFGIGYKFGGNRFRAASRYIRRNSPSGRFTASSHREIWTNTLVDAGIGAGYGFLSNLIFSLSAGKNYNSGGVGGALFAGVLGGALGGAISSSIGGYLLRRYETHVLRHITEWRRGNSVSMGIYDSHIYGVRLFGGERRRMMISGGVGNVFGQIGANLGTEIVTGDYSFANSVDNIGNAFVIGALIGRGSTSGIARSFKNKFRRGWKRGASRIALEQILNITAEVATDVTSWNPSSRCKSGGGIFTNWVDKC